MWQGVPKEKWQAWGEVFQKSKESLTLSSPCPICGYFALHRYYQMGQPVEYISSGQRFVAKGACWQWCSKCKSYEHSSSLVPEWWDSNIRIDESNLTCEPEELDKQLID